MFIQGANSRDQTKEHPQVLAPCLNDPESLPPRKASTEHGFECIHRQEIIHRQKDGADQQDSRGSKYLGVTAASKLSNDPSCHAVFGPRPPEREKSAASGGNLQTNRETNARSRQ